MFAEIYVSQRIKVLLETKLNPQNTSRQLRTYIIDIYIQKYCGLYTYCLQTFEGILEVITQLVSSEEQQPMLQCISDSKTSVVQLMLETRGYF